MNSERIVGKITFEVTKYNSHLIELAEALFGQADAWDIFRKAILRRGNDLRRDIGAHLGHEGIGLKDGTGLGGDGDGDWNREQAAK